MSIPNSLSIETPLIIAPEENDLRLVATVQQASQKIISLRTDLSAAHTRIEMIQVEMSRLQGLYTQVIRLRDEAIAEAEGLKTRVDQLESRLSDATTSRSLLTSQIESLSIDLKSATTKVVNLTDQSTRYQKQILDLNREIVKLLNQHAPKRSWRRLPLIRSLSESTQDKIAMSVKSLALLATITGSMALGAYIQHQRQTES